MKRIYITLLVLCVAMVTLAYLYFSKLNRDTNNSEMSLHAATAKASLVFCFENEKSILDLLSTQQLLQALLPEERLTKMASLEEQFLQHPKFNRLLNREKIYISFLPGEDHEIDFMVSTKFSEPTDKSSLQALLKAAGVELEQLDDFARITLKDSTSFYLSVKNNLVLLSPSYKVIAESVLATTDKGDEDFLKYVKSASRLNKNSVASLYVNYDRLGVISNKVSREKFGTMFPLLNKQNIYGNYSYSYSQKRVMFNGRTSFNNEKGYIQLFTKVKPGKITIDALLPLQTASYTGFFSGSYDVWGKDLKRWFKSNGNDDNIKRSLNQINTKYRLNLDDTFPKYYKDQLMTFRLRNNEYLGAINLTNGDKLSQLLIDISTDYNADIKLMKEPNILYHYFGDIFKPFKRPYYVIIDNYMVFSNYASSLQVFLEGYRNNEQLVTQRSYVQALEQVSSFSNITYFREHKNSNRIVRKQFYEPYYKMFTDTSKLGQFDTFIYQLSSDDGKHFQTNILLDKEKKAALDTIPSSSGL